MIVGDTHAADDNAVARCKPMDIVARSGAEFLSSGTGQVPGALQIVGGRNLEVVIGSHHQPDAQTGGLSDRRVVSQRGSAGLAVGCEDVAIAKRLRSLRAPEGDAIDRARNIAL